MAEPPPGMPRTVRDFVVSITLQAVIGVGQNVPFL